MTNLYLVASLFSKDLLIALFFLLPGLPLVVWGFGRAFRAINEGKIEGRGKIHERISEPKMFWGAIVFSFFVGFMGIFCLWAGLHLLP